MNSTYIANYIVHSAALSAWRAGDVLLPAAWYTVLPLYGEEVSKVGYRGRHELVSPHEVAPENDAFRMVQLPADANGFAVFTGRTLTYICLCLTHNNAAQALRRVPMFEHHPGKLKLDAHDAGVHVGTYLNGLRLFGVTEDYSYFGHQGGLDGLGECWLDPEGKLVFAYVRCNSRHGFESERLPKDFLEWALDCRATGSRARDSGKNQGVGGSMTNRERAKIEGGRSMTKSKEMLSFEDWLYEHNTPGSNKAGSYVTVIEHIGQILRKLPQFADLPVDICTIDDVAKLREIRKAVLAEQKKPHGGIFDGTVLTEGYWANNFCSATVANLIRFKGLSA